MSEDLFLAAAQASPSGMLVVDAQGRIVLTNREAERIFGYTAAELIGQSVDILVPPDARGSHPEKRAGFTAAPAPRPLGAGHDFHGLHKDGHLVPAEIALTPVATADGASVLVSVVDITERKRLERSRQGLERQLQQTQRLEALGALAGGVAHDFNNILGIIVGNVELALGDLPSEHPAAESVQEIGRAAQRASRLVQQVLAFTRQRTQAEHPIDVEPVVRHALDLFQERLPHTVEVIRDLSRERLQVVVEAAELEQTVTSLCTNAWQALQGAPARIDVRLSSTVAGTADVGVCPELRPGARYAVLSVEDTGVGMDAATVARMHEPFFTTRSVGEGAGLGLSAVYGVVRGLAGGIVVVSAVGRGTTVTVYLPAADDEPDQVEGRPGHAPDPAG